MGRRRFVLMLLHERMYLLIKVSSFLVCDYAHLWRFLGREKYL